MIQMGKQLLLNRFVTLCVDNLDSTPADLLHPSTTSCRSRRGWSITLRYVTAI
jgi:hypothetical protein